MAKLETTFDANNIEPSTSYDILQPGDYPAHIIQSEMRSTKDGMGQYLWLEMEITDGPGRGRRLFDRLNLINRNEKAVKIANSALSSICRAVGVLQTDDSEDLHHKEMLVKVAVRPAGLDKAGIMRDAQNEIKGYKPLGGSAAPASAPAAASASAPKTPPWKRAG